METSVAYCRDYIKRDNAKLSYTYVCENSLKSPPYLIVRQYIDDIAFEMFEFAYRDVRLMCSMVQLSNGKKYGGCEKYGIRNLQPRYDNGSYTIDVGVLNPLTINELFAIDSTYRYPEFVEQSVDIGCAVVMGVDNIVYWRYRENELQKLAECLLNFEIHATKKKLKF